MDVGNIAELNTFLVLDAIRARGQATRRQIGTELAGAGPLRSWLAGVR